MFTIENHVEPDWVIVPASNIYTVTSTGRFFVAVRARDPNAPPINVVLNWPALLKR